MEGSRRLGMVAPGPGRSVTPIGAECEITECQPLPDGRAFCYRKLDCHITAHPLSDKPTRQRPPFCLYDENMNPNSQLRAPMHVHLEIAAQRLGLGVRFRFRFRAGRKWEQDGCCSHDENE